MVLAAESGREPGRGFSGLWRGRRAGLAWRLAARPAGCPADPGLCRPSAGWQFSSKLAPSGSGVGRRLLASSAMCGAEAPLPLYAVSGVQGVRSCCWVRGEVWASGCSLGWQPGCPGGVHRPSVGRLPPARYFTSWSAACWRCCESCLGNRALSLQNIGL